MKLGEDTVKTTLQSTLFETNSAYCIPLLSATTIDLSAPCCHEGDEGMHPTVIRFHSESPDDLLLGATAAMGVYQLPMEEAGLLVNPTQQPDFSCETQAVDLPACGSTPMHGAQTKLSHLLSVADVHEQTYLLAMADAHSSSPLDAVFMVNMLSPVAASFVHTHNLVVHIPAPTP